MAFDQKLWDANACGCRCLLELVKRKQNRIISAETFYNEHAHKFECWREQQGATNTVIVCMLAQALQLAGDLDTFIDPERLIKEWKRKDCYGMLLHTERMPDDLDPQLLRLTGHVMLATDITQNGFAVWNPTQDGKAHETIHSWLRWQQWMMRATVLYRFP